MPVDVNTMVTFLPRNLSDDHASKFNTKKQLIHRPIYLSGVVKKRVVKQWLHFIINQPLYKVYNIVIDLSQLDGR